MSGVAVPGGTSLRGTAPQRAAAALLAGALAIAANTALLAAADAIPLVTARGGLLKLLKVAFGDTLARLGAGALWTQSGLPAPGSNTFQLGFHVVVGLAMALLYGLALETWLTGPPWRKGLVYAPLSGLPTPSSCCLCWERAWPAAGPSTWPAWPTMRRAGCC